MNTQPSSATPEALCYRRLVAAAVLAPSPDNNQPWRFVSRGPQLDVYLDPERTLPSDVNRMFDLVGLGAAVENACIAAGEQGYRAEVHVGPGEPAASITFQPGAQGDPLAPRLASRHTCRKMFSRRPVDPAVRERLSAQAAAVPEVQVDWITDRRGIRAVARLVGQSDRLRFEYEPFHNEVFRQLRFTAEAAEQTRDGLDLRTLELPPGTGAFLGLLRPWGRMRMLQRLGLVRFLTVPSILSVLASGAIAVLSVPQADAAHFLATGRAVQRLWLAADAEGLSVHPLGSLPIFFAHAQQYQGRKLSPAHQRQSARLIDRFARLVPSTSGRTVMLLLRTGHSRPPSVRSLRRPVEEVYSHAASAATET